MLQNIRRIATSYCRVYSTAPEKPSLKLVAELRKRTEVSIVKAREALGASNNDIDTALDWLRNDLITSGVKKAAKVGGRATNEGLVSISVLSNFTASGLHRGIRAAMIELNCETDFVGRNELFGQLAADIAHTAAVISEPTPFNKAFQPCTLGLLQDAPLISQANPGATPSGTVASSIRDAIAKVGENISLRRAVTVAADPPAGGQSKALRLASYVHGTIHQATQGRIGTLALLALKYPSPDGYSERYLAKLEVLERALARQIVGFDTRSIKEPSTDDETALYNQPFMMLGGELNGQRVGDVLGIWSRKQGIDNLADDSGPIDVENFAKWTVAEPLDSQP